MWLYKYIKPFTPWFIGDIPWLGYKRHDNPLTIGLLCVWLSITWSQMAIKPCHNCCLTSALTPY